MVYVYFEEGGAGYSGGLTSQRLAVTNSTLLTNTFL